MKSILTFVLGVLLCLPVLGQQITQAEYFIGQDPGYGNGIPLSLSQEGTDYLIDFNADLSGLEEGVHTIQVRAKEDNGPWTHNAHHTFFIGDGQSFFPERATAILEAEYFIGADPGPGNGTALTLTPEGDDYVIDFTADLSELEGGIHTIQVRAKDDMGQWSQNAHHTFFIGSGEPLFPSASTIVEVEYYVDEDPGLGNGQKWEVEPAADISIDQVASLGDLPLGPHTLFIRAKDDLGQWSQVARYDFNICSELPPAAGFDYILNGNTVTIVDTSEFASEYLYTFGDGNESNISAPRYTYAETGQYEICQTVINSCETETVCTVVDVVGVQSYTPKRGGNSGVVTMILTGAGFDENTTVELSGPDNIETYDQSVSENGDILSVSLDLIDVQPGFYDVLVNIKGQDFTYENGFEVLFDEQGPQIWTEVIGRSAIRPGRFQTFTISYGNSGLTDAYAVPLWIEIFSDTVGLEVEILTEQLQYDADGTVSQDSLDQVLPYIVMDSLYFEPDEEVRQGISYPLIIPSIYAEETGELNIRIRSNSDVNLVTWANSPMLSITKAQNNQRVLVVNDEINDVINKVLDGVKATCMYDGVDIKMEDIIRRIKDEQEKAIWDELKATAISLIPGADCATEFYNFVYEAGQRNPNAGFLETTKYVINWIENYAATIVSCTPLDLIKRSYRISKTSYRIFKALRRINKGQNEFLNIIKDDIETYSKFQETMEACEDSEDGYDERDEEDIDVITSFDPNEKVGPGVLDGENFTFGDEAFAYRVYFENIDTAQAAAQEVIIIDTLDAEKLDLSTFRLGTIGFGKETLVTPPPGLQSFSADVDVSEEMGLIVRINATLDPETGIARWQFLSLDPETGDFTEDPFAGFLPPNVDKGEGEGFVSYNIRPFEDLSTGTVIANFADIYFDFNEPIRTNTFINTIDKIAPESNIAGLEAVQTDTTFLVEWGGFDANAGVSSFDVYVSINEGPFYLWQYDTEASADMFEGAVDSTYSFFTIARDHAGNIEEVKSIGDATTRVELEERVTSINELDDAGDIRIFPNPVSDVVNIMLEDYTYTGELQVELVDIYGKAVTSTQLKQPQRTLQIDMQSLPTGTYIITIKEDGNLLTNKLLKK